MYYLPSALEALANLILTATPWILVLPIEMQQGQVTCPGSEWELKSSGSKSSVLSQALGQQHVL